MTVAQQTYLARVLPWPTGEDDPGYIDICWSFQPKDHVTGKPYPWSGQACRSVDEALLAIERASKQAGTRDIYACQSRQLTAKSTPRGKILRPIRNTNNSTLLKALFLDVDLKDYGSNQELGDELSGFIYNTKLPKPNVIVATTGGYHVYWTMDRYLTVAEWSPLAHSLVAATKSLGLKCDVGCTTDSARVLRVPDTINFKRNELVRLGGAVDINYPVEELEKILLPFKVIAPKTKFVSDPVNFPSKTPLETDELSAGIEPYPQTIFPFKDVMTECPLVLDALTSGGKDYTNPLWNLTTLLSTFTEEGLGAAHLMGKRHPGYTRESTNALFDRKFNERIEKSIGWPSCRAFYGAGSKLCESCKHFSKGKSPLNFALANKLPPILSPQNKNGGIKTVSVLPSGYTRNAQGFIQKSIVQEDGTTKYNIICELTIGDGWLQQDPWSLHFSAEVKPNDARQISMAFEIVDVQEMRKELSRQGITLHGHQVKPVGEFLLSWIDELKKTKDAVVNTAAFGWNSRDGKLEGFVYAGKLFTPTGKRIAPPPDQVIARRYTPSGDIQPWIDAAKLITDQQRPALDMILAASFAAPLVRFTHMRGLTMSCVGKSGIGKSTALDIGLSVWGHPQRAKNAVNDTDNSVMGTAGEIKSLPIYWDDIRLDDMRKFHAILFQNTYGKEKNRMNQAAKQKEAGTWSTIMISTSNYSLMEYSSRNSQTDPAGLYRLFEVQVEPANGAPGQIAKADAARMVGKLDDNFGRVGEAYAEYIGSNFLILENEVLSFQKALDIEVNALQEERLWTSLMACICVGASVANRLGFTEINEVSLKEFLITSLGKLRKELETQAVDLSKEDNVSAVLGNFLQAQRARHTLVTNIIHKGRGKPVKDSILIRNDASKLEEIKVHIGADDKVIRIESTALSEWCKDKGISRHALTKALEKEYDMKVVHGKIGGGTTYAVAGLVYMLEISSVDLEGINIEELISEPDTQSKDYKPNGAGPIFSGSDIIRNEEDGAGRPTDTQRPAGGYQH